MSSQKKIGFAILAVVIVIIVIVSMITMYYIYQNESYSFIGNNEVMDGVRSLNQKVRGRLGFVGDRTI